LVLAEAVAFALRERLGKEKSHQVVEQAARRAVQDGSDFAEVLLSNPDVSSKLSPTELSRLLDPANYLGSAVEMTEKVLSAHGAAKK
jgi:3-carboxy-cis,cis-muconate cycloisomerase